MSSYYESPEAKIFKTFIDWLEQGKKICLMFEQSGIPVPAELVRAFKNEKHVASALIIARPERPEAPATAESDWFWIDAKEVVLNTLVAAILNEGDAVTSKELINRIKMIGHDAKEGSIYNVGSNDNRIIKAKDGWMLRNGIKAPILHKRHVWGRKDVFQKQDLASFRRMAIRHLLTMSDGGLQIMQIFKQLQNVTWLNTPLSKDLVKADLFVMEKESKVRRKGSRKWVILGN